MRTTIKDVAAKSGFSPATVSLVLNGKCEHIAQSTQDEILKVSKELNYRPNRLAVGLITKRTNIIGLILSDPSNFFFTSLAFSIEEECKKNGYLVIYVNSSDLEPRDTEYISTFIDQGVDGIIYAKDPTDPEQEEMYTQLINQACIPVVTIDAPMNVERTTTILMNQVIGAKMAVNHLISYGHKRIGCIAGPSNIATSKGRMEGYKQALEEANISFDASLVYEGNFRMESGSEALPYLLGQNATAVFAFNDMMALGVYEAANRYRMRIPEDISVVGFDDSFFNEVLHVPMTTIYQPINEMGHTAAREMLKMLNIEGTYRNEIIFQPQLKVRASTCKINSKD